MKIYEKIKNLRFFLGLNRVDFSKTIGVPLDTIKSIELKGSNPRSDILVAIAKKWPEHAAWILLGEGEVNTCETGIYKIVDYVDVRFIEQCIVKQDRFSELVFMQGADSEEIGALLILDKGYPISKNTKDVARAVWLESGSMNFSRQNGRGWFALKNFRAWLIGINTDLVYQSTLYRVEKNILEKEHPFLVKECLKPAIDDDCHRNFLSWKSEAFKL